VWSTPRGPTNDRPHEHAECREATCSGEGVFVFGSVGIGVELTQVSHESDCWRLDIGVCGAERAERAEQSSRCDRSDVMKTASRRSDQTVPVERLQTVDARRWKKTEPERYISARFPLRIPLVTINVGTGRLSKLEL
jgi:hypothetical protein